MREIYPSHYAAFHCIAGACPDSCCKEWEIVVDTASAERYRSVSGTLGERLRQAMITDADGDIVFQEHNSRCPFWNAQQLCDIHGELGEDALCETCRLFPRITQDYGDFIEYDISPACPEAARLLFSLTPKQWQLTERSSPAITEEPPEYAAANMRRLQEQRQVLFFRLQNNSASACAQLSACLTLAEQWAGVSQEPAAVPCMEESVLSFLRSCEVLTSDWKQMLEQAANAPEPENLLAYTPALDQEIRLFTMDMLYRYYLRAAYAETPEAEILPVQMAAFAVCIVLLYSRRLGFHTVEQRLRIWQLFVKEIEYNGDNLEELEWQLETNAAFSPAAFRAYFASLGGVQ